MDSKIHSCSEDDFSDFKQKTNKFIEVSFPCIPIFHIIEHTEHSVILTEQVETHKLNFI